MRKKRTPERNAWDNMLYRCLDEGCHAYSRYGGRGITVCARWRNSFDTFLKDMGPRPPGGTLERLNNFGNYEPNNCIWASRKDQARNRRSNTLYTLDGKTQCIAA
jgi:hypothetical protein